MQINAFLKQWVSDHIIYILLKDYSTFEHFLNRELPLGTISISTKLVLYKYSTSSYYTFDTVKPLMKSQCLDFFPIIVKNFERFQIYLKPIHEANHFSVIWSEVLLEISVIERFDCNWICKNNLILQYSGFTIINYNYN